MARKLNFRIDHGADTTLSVILFANRPIDLTGYKAAMQVHTNPFHGGFFVDLLSTENGRLSITDVTNGRVTLNFPHEVTEKYPDTTCVYDVELTSAGGKIYRVLEGQIFIN